MENNIDVLDRREIAKHRDRPTILYYISNIFDSFFEQHGDRLYGDDPAMWGGIAEFDGLPVTVIGHIKGGKTSDNIRSNFGMAHPEGYRKALRLMRQAEKFGRPIICIVDTPGAYCGIGAEERGQGEAIARNLLEMSALKVPIISIVTGEGGSGGALGLAVADRIFMLENATYSVISPKGFASILWKDASREREAAQKMKITAYDLLSLGVIDGIIEEPAGGAHKNAKFMAAAMHAAIQSALGQLLSRSGNELVFQRYEKFRRIGVYAENGSI